MKDRSERRKHEQRVKNKIRRNIKNTYHTEASEETVGKLSSVHGAKCSCTLCGNPRKHFNKKTRQENLSDLDLKDLD